MTINYIEKGQVFENLKYFLVVNEVTEELISYNFYNKHEFYFEPIRNPRHSFSIENVSYIETISPIKDFLKKINKQDIRPLHQHFNKQPKLGIKIK